MSSLKSCTYVCLIHGWIIDCLLSETSLPRLTTEHGGKRVGSINEHSLEKRPREDAFRGLWGRKVASSIDQYSLLLILTLVEHHVMIILESSLN